MIKTTIIGGAGYTGGELIRLLLNHPQCEIQSVHSRSQAGKYVHEIHKDLLDETELIFTDSYDFEVDVIFLCMGHGESKIFMQKNNLPEKLKIIDLSQDFRYSDEADLGFVYGLPEYNRLQIMNAKYTANPGCFATSIQLALLPLAKEKLLKNEIHVSGITGSTGAGHSLTATSHFSWRSSNISLYKPFVHQHLREIEKTFGFLQDGPVSTIHFLPFRGNFTRGILSSVYTTINNDLESIKKIYDDYYNSHPFVTLSENNPDVKQVVNTNKALLNLEKHNDQLLIVSAIDNLIKGASGQAVQNMNLMFGLEETAGLKLKSIVY